jgi:hypothetical protein
MSVTQRKSTDVLEEHIASIVSVQCGNRSLFFNPEEGSGMFLQNAV